MKEVYEKDECISIERMKLLHRLYVMIGDENEVLRMDALSLAPPFLGTNLFGIGKDAHVDFISVHSITCIHLDWSRLTENFLHFIQTLPNLILMILLVLNTYTSYKLYFISGFPKLHIWFCAFFIN